MADAYFLSEKDRNELRRLLEWWRHFRPAPATPDEGVPARGPSIYVAKPSSANGIPGLTGTSPAVPGSDECDIYRIVYDGSDPELTAVENFTAVVLNLSPAPLAQGWMIVLRDAYGQFFAVPQRPLPRCRGLTTGAVAKDNATFTVDNVESVEMGVASPVTASSDTFIISNWAKWESNADQRCDFIITDLTPEDTSIGHGDFAQGACKADQT